MSDFLTKIIDHKKSLLAAKKEFFSTLKEKAGKTQYARYGLFKRMISHSGKINLIAEIKKASPSKGLIREDFDVLKIAKIYREHKVAAISVLTEDKYFLGKPEYVKKVSNTVDVPVLTKDFIIDAGQIYEAWFNEASAVLLITAILAHDQMRHLINVAHSLDLDCLVEVHNEKELDQAIYCGAEIIGINNRDLHTFEVDLKTSERLIAQIPEGTVIVAESGIRIYEEIQWLKGLGANAVLIGETFMRQQDIGQKIDELMRRCDD
ncbi:Indole-3-glycerol phosphate synthase [hydrothermal vent metagenome]|uniref:indole-3-glycerol-phosphate synthase n=1 Tax=hydrothermal vent metagenome TaxID=652676 RepID=A0A3B1DU11_9ZZZZ